MYGFTHRANVTLPDWSRQLSNYYYMVRVESRNKALRRKYYRYIKIERLRLVELGIDALVVTAVCKYLVSLKQVNADRVHIVLSDEIKQLSFNFHTQPI